MSLSLGASNRNYGKKQRKAAGDKTYENLAKFKYLEIILTKKTASTKKL
jgi:hypothetical protein